MKYCLLTLLVVSIAGCSNSLVNLEEPTTFQGKVTKGGKPIGECLLKLQPTEAGYLTELPVSSDGSFKGEAIPGKYMYFVGKSTKASEQVVKQLDAKYHEPNTARLVTVAPGQDLSVSLD